MRISFYILISFLLSACSPYYYFPTYQNIPIHSGKNEIQSAYFLNAENQGFSISYTLSDNFGIFTNVNTFDKYNLSDGAFFADLGLFYFKNSSVFNDKAELVLSITSAYGYGKNNRYREFYQMGINRFFLQPSFILTSDFIDLGASYRFSYVNYNLKTDEGYEDKYNELMDVGKTPFFFAEPHIFAGVGYKWIKLNYHILALQKLNNA